MQRHIVIFGLFIGALGLQLAGLERGWQDALTPIFIGGVLLQLGNIIVAMYSDPKAGSDDDNGGGAIANAQAAVGALSRKLTGTGGNGPWAAGRIKAAAVLMALALTGSACAAKRAPVLVGQAGLGVAQSIGHLQVAAKQLSDASVLSPTAAIVVQQKLLIANDKLQPLPDWLRLIDHAQQAGLETDGTVIDQALAVLQSVGQDLSTVLAGVPYSDATAQLIDLVRQAQQTVQAVLVNLGRVKGA